MKKLTIIIAALLIVGIVAVDALALSRSQLDFSRRPIEGNPISEGYGLKKYNSLKKAPNTTELTRLDGVSLQFVNSKNLLAQTENLGESKIQVLGGNQLIGRSIKIKIHRAG